MSQRGLPGQAAAEHEFEAEHGLPERLPPGERLLWQGSPDWRVLARDALHTRMFTVYFAVLLAWRAANVWSSGGSLIDTGVAVLWLLPAAVVAIAVLSVLAWLMARTSVYTLTDKRVVMRIGIVLTLTFNLPLKRIETAGLLLTGKGFGDIPLALSGGDRIGWLNLWPHARPWRLAKPEPMLRCIPQAQAFAATLQKAWTQATGKTSASVQTQGEMGSADATHAANWQMNALTNKPV